MTNIGLLSDTHTFVHPKIFDFFKDCHQIWHAGDIGNLSVAENISDFKPLIAVYGNIDDQLLRKIYPEKQLFFCEQVKVLMTHIGGYPGKYAFPIKDIIKIEKPKLFISGHSHILKVMFDQKNQLLHINPGAAGKYGFHRVITLVRFTIDGKDIKDLEIMELEK
ncbi:MAG: metallophosphoesterase family protein [Bacteroidetes bacterium]|nr:metallophosphoesterase family protein [Bacteroidota bacterium]